MSVAGENGGVSRQILIGLATVMVVILLGFLSLQWYLRPQGIIEQGATSDPAREMLAGPEPDGFHGLAKQIDQFSTLDQTIYAAEKGGYHCRKAMEVWQRGDTGDMSNHDLICGRSDVEPGPEEEALIVSIDRSGSNAEGHMLRIVGVRLRKPPGFMSRLLGGDSAMPAVAARGIVFARVERFADLTLESLDGDPMAPCELPLYAWTCKELSATRAKEGPKRWDGKPKSVGQWREVVSRIGRFGLDCTALQSADGRTPTGDEVSLVAHCATQSFSGQAQAIDIVVDVATSIPIALVFSIPDQILRVPLDGKAPEHSPGETVLLAATNTGKTSSIKLTPDFLSGDYYRTNQQFSDLTESSRRRIVAINLKQVADVLDAPEVLPTPQLQKLDIASTLLARFGATGVAMVRPALPDASLPVATSIALAECRVQAQTRDCLTPALAERPELGKSLLAALDEAQDATTGLDETHPARHRLELLSRQLTSVRTDVPSRKIKGLTR